MSESYNNGGTGGTAHIPVMAEQCIKQLCVKPDGTYADLTTGGGGHSYEIARRLSRQGRLYCLDRDEYALTRAAERLAEYKDNITYIKDNYGNIKDHDLPPLDGAVMDLGVSSFQLDDGSRGFSYNFDAPLDMRMGVNDKTAYDVVNYYRFEDLRRLLYEYGEEKYAGRIAGGIVTRRVVTPVTSTFDLAELVKAAYPRKAIAEGLKSRGNHPCKRTFQAIRIEVNDELNSLRKGISGAFGCLKSGGVLCVITFHSLEDRIAKTMFREFAAECVCPPGLPACACGKVKTGELPFKKPLLPREAEIAENNRSRSAKLRVVIRK